MGQCHFSGSVSILQLTGLKSAVCSLHQAILAAELPISWSCAPASSKSSLPTVLVTQQLLSVSADALVKFSGVSIVPVSVTSGCGMGLLQTCFSAALLSDFTA